MDGWMDAWMNEWMVGWLDGWMRVVYEDENTVCPAQQWQKYGGRATA